MGEPSCYFFGCWNRPGHHLFAPGGRSADWKFEDRVVFYSGRIHLDGTLAPRRDHDGAIVFQSMGKTDDERRRIKSRSGECPQGQFLRHLLDNGYTAIQWWDRCQGDGRGACNSTLLLEGERTTEECLAALREHFPHVVENLKRAGVELVEVMRG